MSLVIRITLRFLLLISLAGSAVAEDPLQLGLKSAISALSPVPGDEARIARTTAAGHLATYVRKQGRNYLGQYSSVAPGKWVEMSGLGISQVSYGVVSEADRANGIRQRFNATVDCGTYRTRKPGDSVWSAWANGRPMFIPAAITVEQSITGEMRATESSLKYFNPIGTTRPSFNPAQDSLPPGMSSPMARAASPIPSVPAAAPNPTPTPSGITPVPLPAQAPHSPAAAPAVPVLQVLLPPGNSKLRRQGPPSAPPANPSSKLTYYGIGGMFIVAILSGLLKKPKRPSQGRRKPRPADHKPPAPARGPSTVSLPPSLPSALPTPAGNPVDLIQRSDNLLTPAELAFFAVLEPLIHSSHRISSKVRLADLFNAVQGPGQQTAFNKIVGKHIDFVVTDSATSRILCGIELDDSSHNRPERIERDRFVNQVFDRNELPLLRVPCSWTYYPEALRAELAKAGLAVSVA